MQTLTLEQYLKSNLERGVMDHSVRVTCTGDGPCGVPRFYIHPSGVSGETLNFVVTGNQLHPAYVVDEMKSIAGENTISESIRSKMDSDRDRAEFQTLTQNQATGQPTDPIILNNVIGFDYVVRFERGEASVFPSFLKNELYVSYKTRRDPPITLQFSTSRETALAFLKFPNKDRKFNPEPNAIKDEPDHEEMPTGSEIETLNSLVEILSGCIDSERTAKFEAEAEVVKLVSFPGTAITRYIDELHRKEREITTDSLIKIIESVKELEFMVLNPGQMPKRQ